MVFIREISHTLTNRHTYERRQIRGIVQRLCANHEQSDKEVKKFKKSIVKKFFLSPLIESVLSILFNYSIKKRRSNWQFHFENIAN